MCYLNSTKPILITIIIIITMDLNIVPNDPPNSTPLHPICTSFHLLIGCIPPLPHIPITITTVKHRLLKKKAFLNLLPLAVVLVIVDHLDWIHPIEPVVQEVFIAFIVPVVPVLVVMVMVMAMAMVAIPVVEVVVVVVVDVLDWTVRIPFNGVLD